MKHVLGPAGALTHVSGFFLVAVSGCAASDAVSSPSDGPPRPEAVTPTPAAASSGFEPASRKPESASRRPESASRRPESASRRLESASSRPVAGAGAVAPIRDCNTDLRFLNQIVGWQVRWPRAWEQNAQAPTAETLAYWSQAPAVLAEEVRALRSTKDRSRRAPVPVVLRVLDQLESLTERIRRRDPRILGSGREPQQLRWRGLVTKEVLSAIEAYKIFLHRDYLPGANPSIGVSATPNGAACFRKAVAWWTTSDLGIDAIREVGRRHIEASKRELLDTDAAGSSFPKILQRLRTIDAETDAADLIALSRVALRRAHGAVGAVFRSLPSADLRVLEMESHLQDSFPAGYYRPDPIPAYVINPSRPKERRLMAEVIAFHEGIPGHHLFMGYPRDGGLGPFYAGILEGWAIYAEYLADELNLYSSALDRQGMITKHLWAASRLIVEPGIHLEGWSREEAMSYLRDRTALPERELALEVDRYIAMPGQSLAYTLGYEAIVTARRKAEAALGPRFDLRDFHHVVLSGGSRPLGQMTADIDRWIEVKCRAMMASSGADKGCSREQKRGS